MGDRPGVRRQGGRLDEPAQRVYRQCADALSEAEDTRSKSGTWPSIPQLAARRAQLARNAPSPKFSKTTSPAPATSPGPLASLFMLLAHAIGKLFGHLIRLTKRLLPR